MSRKYKVFQVDSFTDTAFYGNPAGVVLDADGLTDQEMQKIAREMNNSETVFLLSPTAPDHEVWLRFFTPTMEVPTCGHATIAAHYIRALENGIETGSVTQKIGIGILPIEIIRENGDLKILITQGEVKVSEPVEEELLQKILKALKLDPSDIQENCPVQEVSTGSSKYILCLKNSDILNRIEPSFSALYNISNFTGCKGYFLFSFDTGREDILTTSRMFAPAMGINEDPVTGNGNGPLGAYLIHNNLVEHDGKIYNFRGEQGVSMGRQGFVDVSVEIADNEPKKVIIGGKAVTVFQTELVI